jgi:hypothetical protein
MLSKELAEEGEIIEISINDIFPPAKVGAAFECPKEWCRHQNPLKCCSLSYTRPPLPIALKLDITTLKRFRNMNINFIFDPR